MGGIMNLLILVLNLNPTIILLIKDLNVIRIV